MATPCRFPFQKVEFFKNLELDDTNEAAFMEMAEREKPTDLIVVSHGWNNDMKEAQELYDTLCQSLMAVLDRGSGGGLPDRKICLLGIFWPSKKFAEEDLIPGGAASTSAGGEELVRKTLENLKGCFDGANADDLLESAIELLSDLEDSSGARGEFKDILARLIKGIGNLDEEVKEEVPPALFELPGSTLIDLASRPVVGEPLPTVGGAAGLGLSGVFKGARQLLNLATYYQMKTRAGRIGEGPAHGLLKRIHARFPDLKLHLVGHSFGGRLVTAVAKGPGGESTLTVDSMTLLQAAFSHNGFAPQLPDNKVGYFRPVVSGHRVRGPALITHTKNDWAVGFAYPLASRVSRDDATAVFGFGEAGDRFGGIGRNGAQQTPEALPGNLLDTDGAYSFQPGKLHNLQSDPFISSHSDVSGEQVAHAIVTAIATT